MKNKKLGGSVSIRFSEADEADLELMAIQTGLKKADIVRIALVDFLHKVKREGVVNFPVRLSKVAEPLSEYGKKLEKKEEKGK